MINECVSCGLYLFTIDTAYFGRRVCLNTKCEEYLKEVDPDPLLDEALESVEWDSARWENDL